MRFVKFLNAMYWRLCMAAACCYVCVHLSLCIRCFEFLTFTGKEGDRRVYWGNYFHLSLSLCQPDSKLFNHILSGLHACSGITFGAMAHLMCLAISPPWRDRAWCLSVSAIPLEPLLAPEIEMNWDICVVSLRLKKVFRAIRIQSASISATHDNRLNVNMAKNSKAEYRVGWRLRQCLRTRVEWGGLNPRFRWGHVFTDKVHKEMPASGAGKWISLWFWAKLLETQTDSLAGTEVQRILVGTWFKNPFPVLEKG